MKGYVTETLSENERKQRNDKCYISMKNIQKGQIIFVIIRWNRDFAEVAEKINKVSCIMTTLNAILCTAIS